MYVKITQEILLKLYNQDEKQIIAWYIIQSEPSSYA